MREKRRTLSERAEDRVPLSRASEDAFARLRANGWFRETGKLAFTHDVNQEEDGSVYGYPGGMIYARPTFANGLSPVFRLGPSDALVLTVCTPPPSRYFGLSTYVWRRQGDLGIVTSRVVSATLANEQVNMLTMNNATARHPAFGQPLVLITTADEATFREISGAFVDAGVPVEAINLEAIPRAKLGRSLVLDGADDLTFSLRSALWPDETEDGAYSLGTYAKQEWSSVFIARSPRGGSRLVRPLEAIDVASSPRGAPLANKEETLLASALALASAVEQRLVTSAGLTRLKEGRMQHVDVDRDRCLRDRRYSPFRLAGASGVNIRSGCFGETGDCTYAISDVILPAARPFVALFVGADHRALGNSAFSNVAAYNSGGALSAVSAGNVEVVGYADDRMWRRRDGSGVFALVFASEGLCGERTKEDLAKMDVPCVEIPTRRFNEVFFISRDYVDPATGTAPNSEEMLETRVLYFE